MDVQPAQPEAANPAEHPAYDDERTTVDPA
jgi:hypothetical protein